MTTTKDALESPAATATPSMRHWLDLIVGGSAIGIAVISLMIALRQSQIMERQLAASVWPYLQYDVSNATLEGKPVMSFGVENVGVGPARVHSVSLRYAGKPIREPRELWTACCADLLAQNQKLSWRISTLHDEVLAPNRPKTFLLLTDEPANQPFRERITSEQQKIAIRFCYCSVLEQCWMFDSETEQTKPVAACPGQGTDDYRG